MNWKREWRWLALIAGGFLALFYLPVGTPRFDGAVLEAFHLGKWYAREHVLLCLVPAFFIAGAIAVFVSQASVMKYLGAGANKVVAYGVASVSGTVLAVCSCTVLPLFAGIYRMGAGLGPASAFLYAGPAINILAIILTARILGLEMGIARAVGAIGFAVVIGLLMHLIFRREEQQRARDEVDDPAEAELEFQEAQPTDEGHGQRDPALQPEAQPMPDIPRLFSIGDDRELARDVRVIYSDADGHLFLPWLTS